VSSLRQLFSCLLTSCSVYQEYLARSLTDKYSTLSSQMDNIIDSANSQINNMGTKLEGRYSCQLVTGVLPLTLDSNA